MSFFTSWDVLGISLVLALRFLGPFALGLSIVVWTVLGPSGSGARAILGVALGALICLAPILLFLVLDVSG